MLNVMREIRTHWALKALLILVALSMTAYLGYYFTDQSTSSMDSGDWVAMVADRPIATRDFQQFAQNLDRQYRSMFGDQYDQFKPQLEQVAAFKKRKGELEKKIDVLDGLDRARTGPVRVLNELATRTPDRLWLTSLSTKGRTISLRGQSLDNELVALFLRSLGESEYFANVDLDSTKLGSERAGLKLVTFRIQAEIVNPKEPTASEAKKTAKTASRV